MLIDEFAGGTQRRFAEKVGISPSVISDLFGKRKNSPGADLLYKIATAYPEVSMNWLIAGTGDMCPPEHRFNPTPESEEAYYEIRALKRQSDHLSKIREIRGLSIEEVAAQGEMLKSDLEDIEAGRIELPFEFALRLASVFKLPYWYIVNGGDPKHEMLLKLVSLEERLAKANLRLNQATQVPPSTVDIGNQNSVGPATTVKVVQDEMPAPYKGNDNLRVLTVQVADDNEENIEFVSTRAAAGYAQGGFLEREFIGQLPSFRLPDSAYRNGSFRCFQVSGDSMQSTLYDGDWIICRYVEQWDKEVQDTYVHVVVTEDTVLVKRLTNQLNERGKLSLHSDNPAYPVQFIDGAEVREVWVAVAKVSRQFINPRYDVGVELARHDAVLAEVLQRLEKAGF